MITDTFLCEKRQETLGVFSLERRRVQGGMRTACELSSTDDPLVSPFLVAEKERDVQRSVDMGETLTRVSVESSKKNPIPLGFV